MCSSDLAARLKAAGVKSGVPDICLPVPRAGYHGLYIELKRQKGGRISPEQTEWIDALIKQGYCAAVCRGWEAAREEILRYLTIKRYEQETQKPSMDALISKKMAKEFESDE